MAAVNLSSKGIASGFICEEWRGAKPIKEGEEENFAALLVQERERDANFYRENFVGKSHQTLLARDSPNGPLALSIVYEGECFKGLLRTSRGSEWLEVDARSVQVEWWRRLIGLAPSTKSIVSNFASSIPLDYLTSCISPQAIVPDLIELEEKQIIKRFKFGVTYLRAGQTSEHEMMSNSAESSSEAFNLFLKFLGDRIQLRGWKKFRAGLDVKNDLTGEFSIFKEWNGYEIMFHVATLLPYNSKDSQQLERKRHIGNDIVIIVFQDSDSAFDINTLSSKQTQVVILVRPKDKEGLQYHITACRKNNVVDFGPKIPSPPELPRTDEGRDFLYHKLLCAELASYRCTSFQPKIERTRRDLLQNIAEKHLPPT